MIPLVPINRVNFPRIKILYTIHALNGLVIMNRHIRFSNYRKEGQGQAGPLKYEIRSVAQFNDHQAQVVSIFNYLLFIYYSVLNLYKMHNYKLVS